MDHSWLSLVGSWCNKPTPVLKTHLTSFWRSRCCHRSTNSLRFTATATTHSFLTLVTPATCRPLPLQPLYPMTPMWRSHRSSLCSSTSASSFDNTSAAPDQGALFEAAAQHLSNTLERNYTAGEVREHCSIAKLKRRRRRQTETGVKSRHKQREAERKEYREMASKRLTRHTAADFVARHGNEPAPLPVKARSASVTTDLACALAESIDQLEHRSKPPFSKEEEERRQRGGGRGFSSRAAASIRHN